MFQLLSPDLLLPGGFCLFSLQSFSVLYVQFPVFGRTDGQSKEGKESWCWNEEIRESVPSKTLARKKWNIQGDMEVNLRRWKVKTSGNDRAATDTEQKVQFHESLVRCMTGKKKSEMIKNREASRGHRCQDTGRHLERRGGLLDYVV